MADYFEDARQADTFMAATTTGTTTETLGLAASLTEGPTIMAYPPGLSLATITIGAGRTMFGAPPKLISATVTPVFKGTPHVVHAASGWAFYPTPRTFRVENGEELTFELPHVDAEGWRDTAGNEFPALLDTGERDRGWAYHAKFTVVGGSGPDSAPHRYEKVFQPLVGQTQPIDVDLIPDGWIGEPVSAPAATVTDFLGISGSVSKEALEEAGLGAPSDPEIAGYVQDPQTLTGAALVQTFALKSEAGATDADIAAFVSNPATSTGNAIASTVASGVDLMQKYGLGALFAGYALRTTMPVAVVTLGSSTTQAEDQAAADRWVNKLIARMQAAYPSGTGTESTVGTLSTARNTTPGIHGYNGGVSGTNTATYLTDAKVAQIGVLQPRVITHMVGSNDYNEQMPLATYRANIVGWLDKLDAACPPPVVHVLVQAHRRGGPVQPITWAQYGAVLKDLARTRANCVFVDNSHAFEAAGVPDTDPLDLLKPDLVHLTPAGHDMTFRLMADHLHVGPPVAAASGAAPSTSTPTPGSVITSDSFSGADLADIAGRTTDNYLGGSLTKTWVCDPAANVGTTAGRLVRKTSGAAFFAGIQMDVADHEIAFTLVTTPANDLMVTIRRALGAVAGSPDDYRFVIGVNGSAVLRKRVSGAETVLATLPTAGTFAAGTRVAVRATKDKIRVIRNGVIVAEVTDTSIAGPGWVGFSGVGTTTGWEVDNLTIAAALA